MHTEIRRMELVLHEVLKQVQETRKGLALMANTLDDVLNAVTAESTADDSIITLLTGIKGQLDALLAGGLTADQQAKVDAVFAAATGNAAKVNAAIAANTPAPAPPVVVG